MKYSFKKIFALGTSALLIGMTAMVGVGAANYPQPFVVGGQANVAVVYGTGSGVAATDQAQATQIASGLMSLATGGVGLGSETIKIAAPGNDLTFGEGLGDVREKLTESHLPILLADGKIRSGSSTIDYEQWIDLGVHAVTFDNLGDEENYVVNTDLAEDVRPVLHLGQGSGVAWTLVVDFDDDFNATDVRAGEKLVMAGKEYTISPDLDVGDDLVLFASTQTVTPGVGDTATVTIDGITYTIVVEGANTDQGTATINIDGHLFQVEEGDTEWVGDQKFYINRVFMQTVPVETASVEIFAGAEELKIVSGDTVQINDDDVDSVVGTITGADGIGAITQITFAFTPADLDLDTDEATYLEIGEGIADPVFGTIVTKFDSASMELKDSDKGVVEFKRSDNDLLVSFANREGNEYTIELISDDETAGLEWYEDFYTDNTVALGKNNITLLQEGSAEKNYITRVAKVTSVKDDEITFRDESTSATTTRKDAERIWTTGAYACNNVTLTYGATSELTYIFDGWFLGTDAECAYTTATSITAEGDAIDDASANYLYSIDTIYTENNAVIGLDYSTAPSTSKDITVKENFEETGAMTATVTIAYDTDNKGELDITLTSGDWDGYSADDEGDNGYYLSAWGAYAEADEEEYDKVTLYIPSEEVTYDVYLGSAGEAVTPDIDAILVTDAEISTVQSRNLVVIGGSCINSVAATLVGGSLCTDDWTTATEIGTGQFLIKSYANPYATDQIALLVAGYEREDTVNAATFLRNIGVDTTVGKTYIGTTATQATLQVS